MPVVTLTGHLGSMGTIATRVADGLGYTLADRELLTLAAQALGWSESEVQELDERTHGQGSRLARLLREFMEHAPVDDLDAAGLSALVGSTYAESGSTEMRPRDERYIDVLSALVRSLASRGDAVIVGRGGQALLAGQPGVMHVRVVCDQEERIRRIAARDGMTAEAARDRVQDSDTQREAWHQKYFRIDYRSPYLYHLVVNSGWMSDEVAAETIVRLVRALMPGHVRPDGPNDGPHAPHETHSRQDWGWIEIVDPEAGAVLARGHLFATVIGEGGWEGVLESLHATAGAPSLTSGRYFARFGRSSGTDHAVQVHTDAQSVRVVSEDAMLPAVAAERSGKD